MSVVFEDDDTVAYLFWQDEPGRELPSEVLTSSLASQRAGLRVVCRGLPTAADARDQRHGEEGAHYVLVRGDFLRPSSSVTPAHETLVVSFRRS